MICDDCVKKDAFIRTQRLWINMLANQIKDKNRKISELEEALESVENEKEILREMKNE